MALAKKQHPVSRDHERVPKEPVELIFDPDSVDWHKVRIVKALRTLNCFDEDNWPNALHLRIDKIKNPEKIISILLAHFRVPDETRKNFLNQHPLRSFQFLAKQLEHAVYDEVLVWRVKTLFPEVTAAAKPLLSLSFARQQGVNHSIDTAEELQRVLANDDQREKFDYIFRDPATQVRVNQFANHYCHKAVEYVLPVVSERVDDFLVTLFVESGPGQAKQLLDGAPDSERLLRDILASARKQTIEVVKNDLTVRFGIRRGPSKGAKKSRIQISKSELEEKLPRTIRECWEHGESTSRGDIAKKLGFRNAKALDRFRNDVLKDKRPWKKVVADATK